MLEYVGPGIYFLFNTTVTYLKLKLPLIDHIKVYRHRCIFFLVLIIS